MYSLYYDYDYNYYYYYYFDYPILCSSSSSRDPLFLQKEYTKKRKNQSKKKLEYQERKF